MSSRTYLSGAVRVQRKISIELSAKQWNFYDDPSAETTTKFINRQRTSIAEGGAFGRFWQCSVRRGRFPHLGQ